MNIVDKKWKAYHQVDDLLGDLQTHLVAGFVGGMYVGFISTSQGSAAFGLTNSGGAIDGNYKQIWLQLVGALFIIGWDSFWTSAILLFIKYVLRIPLRMPEADLLIGDDAIHGEEAYAFYHDGEKTLLHGDWERNRSIDPEYGIGGVDVIKGRRLDSTGNAEENDINPAEEKKQAKED
jgi:ammonium transporter, Amt family